MLVRGRHDLIVKVKNEEIDGSLFRMFVKIPPSQLRQDVHEIGGFSWLCHQQQTATDGG